MNRRDYEDRPRPREDRRFDDRNHRFRDERRFDDRPRRGEEMRPARPPRFPDKRRMMDGEGPHKRPFYKEFRMKPITKMFTSKDEMIDYVNNKGQEGLHIDIFKIEDGLYKVVVFEEREAKERV